MEDRIMSDEELERLAEHNKLLSERKATSRAAYNASQNDDERFADIEKVIKTYDEEEQRMRKEEIAKKSKLKKQKINKRNKIKKVIKGFIIGASFLALILAARHSLTNPIKQNNNFEQAQLITAEYMADMGVLQIKDGIDPNKELKITDFELTPDYYEHLHELEIAKTTEGEYLGKETLQTIGGNTGLNQEEVKSLGVDYIEQTKQIDRGLAITLNSPTGDSPIKEVKAISEAVENGTLSDIVPTNNINSRGGR